MTHVPSGAGAVMASRHEPNDSLDDFPTPPWGTRALIEHVLRPRYLVHKELLAWDPACNRGYMVRPLREYFRHVYATDVHDYRDHIGGDVQQDVIDFLPILGHDPAACFAAERPVSWIVSNPPFVKAEEFIERARMFAMVGAAMLVRTSFLEGESRYKQLFKPHPPTIIAQFAERLPMLEGRCASHVIDPKTHKLKRASTATAYVWLVWVKGRDPEPFQWIPPCRKKLERDTDYLEPPRLPREADNTGVPPGTSSPRLTSGGKDVVGILEVPDPTAPVHHSEEE